MVLPPAFVAEYQDVSVQAAGGVLPEDAVITITTEDETLQQQAQVALEELADGFVAYRITADTFLRGAAMLTFQIPKGFNPQRVALFRFDENGAAQQLEAVLDVENRTITVEVYSFGMFALAQLRRESAMPGDVNGDGYVNARDARLLLLHLAEMLEEGMLDLSAADFNGDGAVNSRDARALLRYLTE